MDLHLDWIQALFEIRREWLTPLFQLFTFLGEIEGYILVIAAIHVAWDKRLAFRLSVVVLLTMTLNHGLKSLIANPRPFVAEGSFAEKWAVSPNKAAELAAEYSTPSGHAMAGASFYAYLAASVRHPAVRVLAVAVIGLTGASRPYLGVHYVEDILLGWAIGLPIAVLAIRYGDRAGALWNRLSPGLRLAFALGGSFAVWVTTRPLYADNVHGVPAPFLAYLGFLSGVVIAFPLEERWVGFRPRSRGAIAKAIRFAISVGLVAGTLVTLDAGFARIAPEQTPLGSLLRYARYALAGFAGILVAPSLFVRLNLAEGARTRKNGDGP